MQVLIVDDQPRTRQSLKLLLKTVPAITEIREAADGLEALDAVREAQPQVVIMDARMPNLDGLEAIRIIKASWPKTRVILLSMYQEYQEGAKGLDIDAFVSKGDPPEKLLEQVCALLGSG
jgi:DNA-binding NarL/FixJ family response regulator